MNVDKQIFVNACGAVGGILGGLKQMEKGASSPLIGFVVGQLIGSTLAIIIHDRSSK